MLTREQLKTLLGTLPNKPGCYKYLDADGEVIYVGKAKNLKRRVSSYFNKEHTDRKTRALVQSIASIKYIIVPTESDALLLENNLIKEHKPRFNILLKDDKQYPYIVITKEEYPRIYLTRNVDSKKHTIYGPYSDVNMAYKLIHYIRDTFFIRTCTLPLTDKGIKAGKYKICLRYHIKKCKAPCVGYITRDAYANDIHESALLLKGDLSLLIKEAENKMLQAAESLAYEEAEIWKMRIDKLRNYKAKLTTDCPGNENLAVYAFEHDDKYVYGCFFHVQEGAIIRAVTDKWRLSLTPIEEVIPSIITNFEQRHPFKAHEVITNQQFEWMEELFGKTKTSIPQKGHKSRLLALAQNNISQMRKEMHQREEKLNPKQAASRLLKQMQQELDLPKPPALMECFDNSNIQGTNAVSACTVFVNGKPAKSKYRKFHVKTVIGANDYDTMREVITRKYSRVMAEGGDLPDLIVIDGGKGQLRAACETLDALGLLEQIPIIGLAERLEEVYKPGDKEALYLSRDSETLRRLKQIRDEAHRFGITYHRLLRSKEQTKSILDEVPGVGPETKKKLLKQFKSVEKIKEASLEAVQAVIGKKKGEVVKTFLQLKQEL